MKKNKHGANLFELAEKYHFNVKDIRDFSSNINHFWADNHTYRKHDSLAQEPADDVRE